MYRGVGVGGGTEYVTRDNEECNIAASADTGTWGQ